MWEKADLEQRLQKKKKSVSIRYQRKLTSDYLYDFNHIGITRLAHTWKKTKFYES